MSRYKAAGLYFVHVGLGHADHDEVGKDVWIAAVFLHIAHQYNIEGRFTIAVWRRDKIIDRGLPASSLGLVVIPGSRRKPC